MGLRINTPLTLNINTCNLVAKAFNLPAPKHNADEYISTIALTEAQLYVDLSQKMVNNSYKKEVKVRYEHFQLFFVAQIFQAEIEERRFIIRDEILEVCPGTCEDRIEGLIDSQMKSLDLVFG